MIRLNEQVLRISSERLFYHKFWFVMLLLLIPLLFSQEVLAFQYENYVWGMSKKQTEKLIKENGYNISGRKNLKENNDEALRYVDSLFDTQVNVNLFFTPKSKKLYSISIFPIEQYENADMFYSYAFDVLKERYGKPREPSGFNVKDKYYWKDGNTQIVIQHQVKSYIYYLHKKYKSIQEEETKEIHMKETKDKL
ncbi:MAG: hypothetical protein K9L17_14370 [Clostridiales bacterium]|nr:hypothetical protein [Clostridiales bacterium]